LSDSLDAIVGAAFEESLPVDVAKLLGEIAALLRRYVVLPDLAAETMALWVAHTYAMSAWEHTGYLALISPLKRCGKTTALQTMAALVYRPVTTDNVSPAAMYRVIEEQSPTLILDELDRVPRGSNLWTILNSGHNRGGVVRRCGPGGQTQEFSTWCPKLLAYIRNDQSPVPGTVEDRSIQITLRRQTQGECEKLRSRVLDVDAAPLRERLARWADQNRDGLALARPATPDLLDARAADCWEPLLAVADLVGGHWPDLARTAAASMASERAAREAQGDHSALLLGDIRDLVESGDLDIAQGLSAIEACAALRGLDERPWALWNRIGLRPVHLAALLGPFELRTTRRGSRSARRYPADALREAITRYVTPVTPVTTEEQEAAA